EDRKRRALDLFFAGRRVADDLREGLRNAAAILDKVERGIHASVEIAIGAVVETDASDMTGAAGDGSVIDVARGVFASKTGPAVALGDWPAGIAAVDEHACDAEEIVSPSPKLRRQPRQQLQHEERRARRLAERKILEPD